MSGAAKGSNLLLFLLGLCGQNRPLFHTGRFSSLHKMNYCANNYNTYINISIVGINGKIDPLSEYDEVDEEVIYSQESPNMVEFYRDFDWEFDRFVEYRLPIKKPL
jgi:hypothetical protein